MSFLLEQLSLISGATKNQVSSNLKKSNTTGLSYREEQALKSLLRLGGRGTTREITDNMVVGSASTTLTVLRSLEKKSHIREVGREETNGTKYNASVVWQAYTNVTFPELEEETT